MFGWLLLILALSLTVPTVSDAEIYRWTDSDGRVHFAQALSQIPGRYRHQARQNASASPARLQTFDSSLAAPTPSLSRTFRIPFRREHSLMRVDALINGHLDVPFYIDTGASGVSLPASYAHQLGIQIGPDTERIQVRTANGVIATPLVRLDSVKLGAARVDGLMATVNPTMQIGLLGGSFFNNFTYGVDPAASVITLTRNHAVTSGLGEVHWRRRFAEIREPLAELEEYLEGREISRQKRRAELEQRRAELKTKLRALEIEANHDDVPASWRR